MCPVICRLLARTAVEAHLACAWRQHAGEHLQQRRLAASGRADDGEERARLDLRADILQRGERTIRRSEPDRDVLDVDCGELLHRLVRRWSALARRSQTRPTITAGLCPMIPKSAFRGAKLFGLGIGRENRDRAGVACHEAVFPAE